MFTVLKKEKLNPTVTRMVILAPAVAAHAQAGQFVILRAHADGERIPLTVADYDRVAGTVTVIYQTVGATTARLDRIEAGEALPDFVGPLGNPSDLAGLSRVLVVSGGVGSAIALPVVKACRERGCEVHAILGFRNRDLVILEEEFSRYANTLDRMSDDGSWGEKGLVTDALRRHLEADPHYDKVITIGPLPMMKYVCRMATEWGLPSVASMNPIMIDGTGMCGGCRLTVGGKTVFACVDGPEFDGAQIDFDTAILRSKTYADFERHRYEAACHLFEEDRHD